MHFAKQAKRIRAACSFQNHSKTHLKTDCCVKDRGPVQKKPKSAKFRVCLNAQLFSSLKKCRKSTRRCTCGKQDQMHVSGLAKRIRQRPHVNPSFGLEQKGCSDPWQLQKEALNPSLHTEPNFSDCKLGLSSSTSRVIVSCRFPLIYNLTVWGLRRHNFLRTQTVPVWGITPIMLMIAPMGPNCAHDRRPCKTTGPRRVTPTRPQWPQLCS